MNECWYNADVSSRYSEHPSEQQFSRGHGRRAAHDSGASGRLHFHGEVHTQPRGEEGRQVNTVSGVQFCLLCYDHNCAKIYIASSQNNNTNLIQNNN